jgi:hypothetical protein
MISMLRELDQDQSSGRIANVTYNMAVANNGRPVLAKSMA